MILRTSAHRFVPGVLGAASALAALLSGTWPAHASASNPPIVPAGNRTLGIDVNLTGSGNYAGSFSLAKSAGMQCVTLSLDWSDLEPVTGTFDDTLLDIANEFYPPQQTSVILIVRPINTNHIEMPADLAGQPFDSPAVIRAFEGLLDNINAHTPQLSLSALAIGNEVDAELGSNQAAWNQFNKFYAQASRYERQVRPGTKIGVIATFPGLTSTDRRQVAELNRSSDVVLATYYPLNADFSIRPPSSIADDFDSMAASGGGKSLILTECGYPSGQACNSTEELQARFIDAVFASWDTHAAAISSITFSRMSNPSPESVDQFLKYYGISTPAFRGYLATLGLRTYPGSGEDKPAWTELESAANARGW